MRLPRFRGAPKPPAGVSPTVEWQVNGRCNYDCSYCIQSRHYRQGVPDSALVAGIIAGFARLPGTWEIKMSGGEPFAYRGFLRQVIGGLVSQTVHRISVLTNLSAPLSALTRLSELTGERLRIVSASVHLEHVILDEFLDKASRWRQVRAALNPNSSFVINSVLVPGRLDAQADLKARVEGAGFRYFPQLMKIKGGVFPYSARDRALVEALVCGSHAPWAVNRAPNYQGLHCHAGVWYLVVDQRGEAWSCRTGKRFADTDAGGAYLGNISNRATGQGAPFVLRAAAGLCPYPICPCTVPANRGIVRLPSHRRSAEAALG